MALAQRASGLWLALLLLVAASMSTFVQAQVARSDISCLEYQSADFSSVAGDPILDKFVNSEGDCATRCFKHAMEFGEPDGCRVANYNQDTTRCFLRSGVTIDDRTSVICDNCEDPQTVVACTSGKISEYSCGDVDSCLSVYESCYVPDRTCNGSCSRTCCNGGVDPC